MRISTKFKQKLTLLALLTLSCGLAAEAQTPFLCQNNVSYVTRNASATAATLPYTLYSTNISTGIQTALGTVRVGSTNVAVNAIGFNEADGFLYGSEPGTTNILKIGSDGLALRIPIPGLTGLTATQLTFGSGDVAGGYLYLKANDNKIYRIHLTTLVSETFTLPSSVSSTDIAVGSNGKLYSISTDGYLVTYTLTSGATPLTGTATSTRIYLNLPSGGTYNTFTDASGYVYAQVTTASGTEGSGYTYVINPTPSATDVVKYVLAGDGVKGMTNADGATCKTTAAYNLNQPGFNCQAGIAYLWGADSNTLYEINTNGSVAQTTLKSWGNALLNIDEFTAYNNMGFNPKDGCLYLYKAGTRTLIRIRSDLSIEFVTIPTLPIAGIDQNSLGYHSGEFDANGVFYLWDGMPNAISKPMYKVDLDPASPTYRTLIASFHLVPRIGFAMADITYNPVDGYFYGVTNQGSPLNGMLHRINANTGETCSLGYTGIGGSKVAAFSDLAGNLYFRTGDVNPTGNGSNILYKINTPVQNIPCGNTNTALSGVTSVFTGLLSTGAGDGARCSLSPFIGETISGSIWNDGNGNHTVDGSESTSTSPTLPAGETLTVYLVNPQGIIVGKADVGSDGKWTMPDVAPGTYTLVLSNDATKNVTQSATGLSTTLPTDWNNTGYNFGGSNTGTGATGSVTVGSVELTNLNFGINKKPVVADVTADNLPNPGGSTLSPVTFTNPANGYSGSDVEDGTYPATLTGKTVTLTPGTGGDLYYNGVKITTSTTIPNFDPSKVSVDPTDPLAATTVTFTYAVTDAAGVKSDPKTVTVPFAANPLPVTLIAFTVRSEGSVAQLAWSTATEENNTGFDIQRSVDLRSWSTVGFVNTKDGHSKTRLEYGFTDASPRTGMNYYRLRQIDTDGKTSESPVRSVVIEKGMKGLQTYPNPVKDQLTVNGLVGNERIQILDLTGRIVADLTNTSSADTQVINIRSLSEGSYILNVRAEDGSVISKKLIKTK